MGMVITPDIPVMTTMQFKKSELIKLTQLQPDEDSLFWYKENNSIYKYTNGEYIPLTLGDIRVEQYLPFQPDGVFYHLFNSEGIVEYTFIYNKSKGEYTTHVNPISLITAGLNINKLIFIVLNNYDKDLTLHHKGYYFVKCGSEFLVIQLNNNYDIPRILPETTLRNIIFSSSINISFPILGYDATLYKYVPYHGRAITLSTSNL